MIDQWSEKHLSQRTADYRSQSEGTLKAAFDKLLDKPAAAITKTDVREALDATAGARGPYAANHLHAAGHACWKFAIGRGEIEVNPWASIPKPTKAVARDRVLSDDEIVAVWKATEGMARTWRNITRLLILTAQRRSEVAGMTWAEVDLERAMWTIPRERAKNNATHLVPLSASALEIIRSQPREKGAIYVFQSRGETSPSGFSKMKARLDDAVGESVAPWVLHDLRRTAATGMQRLGVLPVIIEAVLNHVSGTRTGIVGVYQRHQYEAERRDALDRWSKHVMDLIAAADTGMAGAVPSAKIPATTHRPSPTSLGLRYINEEMLCLAAENPHLRSKALAELRVRTGRVRAADRETEEKRFDRMLRALERNGTNAGRLITAMNERREAVAQWMKAVRRAQSLGVQFDPRLERLNADFEDQSNSIQRRWQALRELTDLLNSENAVPSNLDEVMREIASRATARSR
nr:site-specific integrase [Neoroseomonas marina]